MKPDSLPAASAAPPVARREDDASGGALHARLAALSSTEGGLALFHCCGSTRWVAAMLERAPFPSEAALLASAEEVWERLDDADHLEAFSHHPRIGADLPGPPAAGTEGGAADVPGTWARDEQAGAARADAATRAALRAANQDYAARFGFSFIVCATGKSAAAMLELLRARLANDPAVEIAVAAREQARITALRLQKWLRA